MRLKKWESRRRKKPVKNYCKECGRVFVSIRNDAQFDSPACRKAWSRAHAKPTKGRKSK